MNAPIFELVAATPALVARLGPTPLRFYVAGEAEQGTRTPYVVWRLVFGSPMNYLAGVPDEDRYGISLDVYAERLVDAREIARLLRDALEPVCYVTSWDGELREAETRLYRVSFSIEWMTNRT